MIALFDFDGTLLPERNNLYWHFVRSIPDRRWRAAKTAAFAQAMAALIPPAAAGVVDVHQMYKLMLMATFSGLPVEVAAVATQRLASRIEDSLHPEMRAVLDHHESDRAFLVTANTEPVVAGFCEQRGIGCIATRLHVAGDRYTGLVDGELNRGHEKTARVLGAGIDPADTVAYGNSLDDEPLLLAVARPVLVDPDKALSSRRRLTAAERIDVAGRRP